MNIFDHELLHREVLNVTLLLVVEFKTIYFFLLYFALYLETALFIPSETHTHQVYH